MTTFSGSQPLSRQWLQLLLSSTSCKEAVALSLPVEGRPSNNVYAVNAETDGSAGTTLQEQCPGAPLTTGLASDGHC
jgi:hypothetical protein